MKCIKKTYPPGVKGEGTTEYSRVTEMDAVLLVAAHGWQYCSKEEYKQNAVKP